MIFSLAHMNEDNNMPKKKVLCGPAVFAFFPGYLGQMHGSSLTVSPEQAAELFALFIEGVFALLFLALVGRYMRTTLQ